MSRSSVSTAVLWREGARTSRRWQTYALRAGFSAALLGLLLFGIWATTALTTTNWLDNTQTAYMGRALFIAFTVIQMVISLFMAPMMTSRAIVEERLEGTLDLLVLTPLRADALLASKVGSRLLLLVTVVLGSLPLLALVTTLGGVSITEVLLVTVGNVVTLLVMGVVGAYFGLFTKSPVIASLAAAGWALLAFLGLPGIYAVMAGAWSAPSHVSPFFASLGDWSGLVLLLTYLPTVWLTWRLGTRLFQLKMANAELRRFFSDEVWSTRSVMIGGAVFGGLTLTILPLGIFMAWAHTVADGNATGGASWAMWLVGGGGRALIFLWTQGLILLATWFYLRLGMDLVDAFEGMLDQMGRDRARRRKSRGHRISRNPVAWREARVSAWGRGGLPLLIGWGLVLFAVAQTGMWLLPGGLLTVGAANAVAATLLTVWLAAGSIEQERGGGTLSMLLVSTFSTWRLVFGKVLALAAPTLPVVLLSIPLILIGFPQLDMIQAFDRSDGGFLMLGSVTRGALTGVWLVAFWLASALASMLIALRVRNPSGAYGAAVGAVGSFLLIPSFLTWVLREWWLAALPFRLLVPVTAPSATALEILFSTALLVGLSVGMYVLLSLRIRSWGSR